EEKFTRIFSFAACKRKNSREFFYLQLAGEKIHANFFICSLQEKKFTRIFLFASMREKKSARFFSHVSSISYICSIKHRISVYVINNPYLCTANILPA
ncbi:MAG: hypothetical protein LBC40_00680, partial [Dysgonamonadaceae bacterium]|nr:hypothetical protein [Dysgonamonadaceae bacterium]